jgi:hypothetical protein
MHLDKIIGTADYKGILRSYLDEPYSEASDWTQEELLDYVNMEHRHLFSTIRNLYEDWFMQVKIFPLVADQYSYLLPRECVNPRRIEYIKAVGVTVGTVEPIYTVNEVTADPEEVQEVQLSGKDNLRHYTSSNRVVRTNGYFMYDDTIQFLPDSRVGSDYYCRIYYLPTAPDLHRALAQNGSDNSITLGDSGSDTTLGYVYPYNGYYKNMYVEIISGTGQGQIRKITEYDCLTGQPVATVSPNWTTNPDGTSHYSIVSPIKEDYQELLALGAVFRAKGIKIEDDTSGAGTVYGSIMKDLIDALERRNHQHPRRVMTTQRSGVWF